MNALLLKGGIHKDSRGILRYANDENPGYYRRFYIINHPDINNVRGWQGHKIEEKAFFVITGSFQIRIVHPEVFERPVGNENPESFLLNEESNLLLRVPGGNYTAIKAVIPDSSLLVLSSLTIEESKNDDYRQPPDKWVDYNTIK